MDSSFSITKEDRCQWVGFWRHSIKSGNKNKVFLLNNLILINFNVKLRYLCLNKIIFYMIMLQLPKKNVKNS